MILAKVKNKVRLTGLAAGNASGAKNCQSLPNCAVLHVQKVYSAVSFSPEDLSGCNYVN